MTTLTRPRWVEAREYQDEAIESWLAADGQGILHMATGTGKTITALLAASRVANSISGPFVLVVAVPYQHLVDQWIEEIEEFGVDPVAAYKSRRNWQPKLERELLEVSSGARELSVVVTTHRTLASEPARTTISRATAQSMLIADEVHHMGAPQTQNALMDDTRLRLGLSATPERWYDDDGTAALREYFGETVFDYGLEAAIAAGELCEYYYIPHIVELQDDEMEEYRRLTAKISRLMGQVDGDDPNIIEDNQALKMALFKRARLIGTAREKLNVLVDLLERDSSPTHSLVYCSDGSTGVDGEGKRHVDATTARLRSDFRLNVERFTAREDDQERERLLTKFAQGEIEVLTSIRCLDEGVDVPETETAYILASTSNPRQYVQRRGRILRQHDTKDYAVIHDFVTVPDTSHHPAQLTDEEYSLEQSLIQKELERVSTFADAARNHPDAAVDGVPTTEHSLQEIKRQYKLLGA